MKSVLLATLCLPIALLAYPGITSSSCIDASLIAGLNIELGIKQASQLKHIKEAERLIKEGRIGGGRGAVKQMGWAGEDAERIRQIENHLKLLQQKK